MKNLIKCEPAETELDFPFASLPVKVQHAPIQSQLS